MFACIYRWLFIFLLKHILIKADRFYFSSKILPVFKIQIAINDNFYRQTYFTWKVCFKFQNLDFKLSRYYKMLANQSNSFICSSSFAKICFAIISAVSLLSGLASPLVLYWCWFQTIIRNKCSSFDIGFRWRDERRAMLTSFAKMLLNNALLSMFKVDKMLSLPLTWLKQQSKGRIFRTVKG